MKLLLKFSTPLFGESVHGMICTHSPIPEIWFTHTSKYTTSNKNNQQLETPFTASGFLTSDFADRMVEVGEERALGMMLNQLNHILPKSDLYLPSLPPSSFFQGGIMVNWEANPFVRGGYSHPSLHAVVGYGEELRRGEEGGKVWLAGEGTWKAGSTIHGALDSGRETAKIISQQLQKSRL